MSVENPNPLVWRTVLLDFYAHIAREQQRRRYREEREHAEWVDLGGEA